MEISKIYQLHMSLLDTLKVKWNNFFFGRSLNFSETFLESGAFKMLFSNILGGMCLSYTEMLLRVNNVQRSSLQCFTT